VTHSLDNFQRQTKIVFIKNLKGKNRIERPVQTEITEEKSKIIVPQRPEVPMVFVLPNTVRVENTDPIMILC